MKQAGSKATDYAMTPADLDLLADPLPTHLHHAAAKELET